MREVAVVTTGFFDGVHLGHRHVLETVVSAARERGEEAIVVTFWPHPRTVLQQDAREFRLLTSLEEKKALLTAFGIDRVEVLPFTRQFASLKAEEYLQLLRDRFGASLVVMGYDNRIGADRKMAREISVTSTRKPDLVLLGPILPGTSTGKPDLVREVAISSTQIRKALEEGRIEEANEMLGYEYGLYGVVVAGNRMGRTMGFPTANMHLYEPLKLVPGNGVYAMEVEVRQKAHCGRNYPYHRDSYPGLRPGHLRASHAAPFPSPYSRRTEIPVAGGTAGAVNGRQGADP